MNDSYSTNDQIELQVETPQKMGFHITPDVIYQIQGLTSYERDVYGFLLSVARSNNSVWLSNKKIYTQLNMSRRKLIQVKNELAKPRPELNGKSLITIQKRKKPGTKENLPSLLTITNIWEENIQIIFGSAPHARGVVHEMHGGSASDAQYTNINKSNINKSKSISKEIPKDAPSGASPPSFSQDVENLCEHLRKKVFSHGLKITDPKTSTQTWNSWLKEMDYIIRLDKKTPKEIKELIDWVHSHDFWFAQIRSPKNLRKKWDTIQLQKFGEEKRKSNSKENAFEENRKIAEVYRSKIPPKLKLGKEKIVFEIGTEHVELGSMSHPQTKNIRLDAPGFKEQLESHLRKMNLFQYCVD